MKDAQIIVELGGATRLAEMLPVSRQAVVNWKAHGISAQYKPAIYALAEQAGFADQINKSEFFGFWPEAHE